MRSAPSNPSLTPAPPDSNEIDSIVDLRDPAPTVPTTDTGDLRLALAIRALQRRSGAFRIFKIVDDEYLLKAQQLHAAVYQKCGYVDESAIQDDATIGTSEDPYRNHADYFAVERLDGDRPNVIATSRMIRAQAELGHNSFQTYENVEIRPFFKRLIEQVDPEGCVEISGLAKQPGENPMSILLLYRHLMKSSAASGHKLWLMSCEPLLFDRLRTFLGDAVIAIGDRATYKGGDVIPTMIPVKSALSVSLHHAIYGDGLLQKLNRLVVEFILEDLLDGTCEPQNEAIVRSVAQAQGFDVDVAGPDVFINLANR